MRMKRRTTFKSKSNALRCVLQAENWITVENVELHSIVKRKEYDESGVISFLPLDGSKFEFMRFRYRYSEFFIH